MPRSTRRTCSRSRQLPHDPGGVGTKGFPIVVNARYAENTRRGSWIGVLSYGFILPWLLGIDALLRSVGLPNDHRSFALRLLLVILAFVPLALTYYTHYRPRIARRLGLIEALPAKAVMDLDGVSLTLDGIEGRRIPWDELASLERSGRDWRLVGSDGSQLATVPKPLMWPAPSWNDAPSFAELVVQLRPDRFALRGARYEPGMTEFSIRRPDDLVGRPRRGVQKRVLLLGIVLAIVAFALLIATTPTK